MNQHIASDDSIIGIGTHKLAGIEINRSIYPTIGYMRFGEETSAPHQNRVYAVDAPDTREIKLPVGHSVKTAIYRGPL